MTSRFGPLPDQAPTRISAASIEELDAFGERLLTGRMLEETLAR